MKLKALFTLLKIKSNTLPITNGAFQYDENNILITDLITYVKIKHKGTPGTLYNIDANGLYEVDKFDLDEAVRLPKLDEDLRLCKTLTKIDDDAKAKISHTFTSTLNDDIRPIYGCVNFNNWHIVSTNAHSLIKYNQPLYFHTDKTHINFNLDKAGVKLLTTPGASGFHVYSIEKKFGDKKPINGHIVFNTEIEGMKATVIHRLVDLRFPDYAQILPETTGNCFEEYIEINQKDFKKIVTTAKRNCVTQKVGVNKYGELEVPANTKETIKDGEKIETKFLSYETGIKTTKCKFIAETDGLIMPLMKEEGYSDWKQFFNIGLLNKLMVNQESVRVYINRLDNKAMLLQFTPKTKNKNSSQKASKPLDPVKEFIKEKIIVASVPKQEPKQDNTDMEAITQLTELVAKLNSKLDNLENKYSDLQQEKESVELLVSSTPIEIKQEPKVDIDIDIDIVEYNSKCFALFGDTKLVKDWIKKEVKGLFNPKLKYNGSVAKGWIVKNEYLDIVKEKFNA